MARLVEEAKKFVTENMANMKKPEASVTDVDLKGVSCDCITYNAKVEVSNHYSHSIPICDISYLFKIAGYRLEFLKALNGFNTSPSRGICSSTLDTPIAKLTLKGHG